MSHVYDLKRRWEKQDNLSIDGAIDALLKHAHGRKLLWWMLEIGRVGGQPFTMNSLQTAFNCGELNVGQRLLDRVITVSAEGYMLMMKEMADERTSRDRELDAASDTDAGRAREPDWADPAGDGDTADEG